MGTNDAPVEAADGIALYENEGWVTNAPVEAADGIAL